MPHRRNPRSLRVVFRTLAAPGALAVLAALSACQATGPYAPMSEAARDTEKAQRLTQQAAKVSDEHPDKAETLLREALAADLYHGPAHNNLGVIYLQRGNLYEAAGEFEWARRLIPGSADPRMNLALTLEKAGKTGEAIQAYTSALEVMPEHLPTIEALTRLQLRSGKADERTKERLEVIALRGDAAWRDWARQQLIKLEGS